MLKLAAIIDAINAKIGTAAAYLVYVVMGIIGYEVVMRTFFNKPTTWVHDLSGWLLVFYIFLGGAWALQKGYFVRVDVAYMHFPARVQAAIELFAGTALMALFSWIMITKGFEFGMRSYNLGETSANGSWEGRVWPAKLVMPIGMILLSLAWAARAIRAAARLIDPASVESEEESGAAG
ncbi:MAG: TRAP transporter small permease subunit [Albidovulum sp.]|nr:TRAP transporter small permease subunit [Albidovulum sp.]